MTLATGTRLGTYEIVGPLGFGGMGEVYRARDTRLGRDVAVKVLPAAVASSPDRIARFEREARTVAGLNHPNIVTLFSVEDEDGIRFLTMELVEGRSLDAWIAPGGLPLPRILDISIPLADALVAAHERGVVHRDLKPGNVMVTRDGRVKVLDFGLAKAGARSEAQAGSETRTVASLAPVSSEGQLLGTLPYMAPEQLRGEPVDARGDLFALGIILYELATGRRPFAGKTPADLVSSILRDAPEPLTSVRADLPGDLERLVERCLEKAPQERAQTALDVSNELRRLQRDAERGVRSAAARPAPDSVASIAVLPFVNRSRDEEDGYFADGLADELLNVLAKIRGLRVAARASSSRFKGKDAPLGEIGRALRVSTLLDGTVRKAGNRVRISVQLVNVSDGYHLWSETYDRTLEDIFAVQDDIARSVVKELRTTLLGAEADSDASRRARAEVAKAARGRGTSPEAYRLYLMGHHLLDRVDRGDTAKGIEYLGRSLELDPALALAWSELGAAYARQANRGWARVEEGYGRARDAIERALALEPDLAEAHAEHGWIRMTYDEDWKGAEASYARALELAPGSAAVLRGAGVLATSLGRLEEATDLFRRALEQDPLSSGSYLNLGSACQAAGRLAEAEDAYRRTLDLAPRRAAARALLALTLAAQGRGEEALEEVREEPEPTIRAWALGIILHGMGRKRESTEALRELLESHPDDCAYQIAELYGARGDAEAALQWLDRAYAQRDGGLTTIRSSVYLRSLHGDPRWKAFLGKLGFEE